MKFPGTDDDLVSRLSSPPEMKAEVGTAFNPVRLENDTTNKEPAFRTDDFEAEPVIEIKTDPVQDEPIKPEIKRPLSYYENEARGIIGFLDGISVIFLPGIYKKRLITTEGLKRSEEIAELIKAGKREELTNEDLKLIDHFTKVEAAIKAIPFKPEEKEMLIGPMAEVMQKYATTLGPEWRLAFAIGAVSFPRIIPLWKGV